MPLGASFDILILCARIVTCRLVLFHEVIDIDLPALDFRIHHTYGRAASLCDCISIVWIEVSPLVRYSWTTIQCCK
jgi:hypothetical protein